MRRFEFRKKKVQSVQAALSITKWYALTNQLIISALTLARNMNFL